MNSYNFFLAFAVALIATTCASSNNYGASQNAVDYANAGAGNAAVGAQAADGGFGSAADGGFGSAADGGFGSAAGGFSGAQSIPYSQRNTQGRQITSSISYPHNKGEILIHRPAAIIVKRPPTKVVVNHPPLVVKPAPVVLHKPPAVVLRKVLVKTFPRPVKVEPVYVNVVKPPAEKYFVNEKQQYSNSPASYTPVNAPGAYSSGYDNAAAGGYQLLNNDQGIAALAGLSNGNSDNYAGSSQGSYGGSSGY